MYNPYEGAKGTSYLKKDSFNLFRLLYKIEQNFPRVIIFVINVSVGGKNRVVQVTVNTHIYIFFGLYKTSVGLILKFSVRHTTEAVGCHAKNNYNLRARVAIFHARVTILCAQVDVLCAQVNKLCA